MSNAGFNAKRNFFISGTGLSISGLSLKSSQDGATQSVAEALNEFGDPTVRDIYGNVWNPSAEYVVREEVDLSAISLGKIVTYGSGTSARKLMITQVVVKTAAGEIPTVTISGVEVESTAVDRRLYALVGTVKPRARAQDVATAFASSSAMREITTTFSANPQVQTVAGTPVFSDVNHGVVEVAASMSDPTGAFEITAKSGWQLTVAQAQNDQDADYIAKTATSSKVLTGTEPSGRSLNMALAAPAAPAPAAPATGGEGDGDGEGGEGGDDQR